MPKGISDWNQSGWHHTEKAKEKMSQHSDNSGKNNPMSGKHQRQETKDKIGATNKNPDKETLDKMSKSAKLRNTKYGNPFLNKKHSDKSKKLISDNHANVSGKNNPNFKCGFLYSWAKGYGNHKISFEHPNCVWHHVNMMFMVACPKEIHQKCNHHVLGTQGIHAHFLEGVLG